MPTAVRLRNPVAHVLEPPRLTRDRDYRKFSGIRVKDPFAA
jgi:hypothetical protein